jgi:hypothetical protein
MSDLEDLWTLQGKTFYDATRNRIQSRAAEIEEVFFKPAAARPTIPEPEGKTDFYHLRRMQGYVEPGSGLLRTGATLIIVAGIIIAIVIALALVFR